VNVVKCFLSDFAWQGNSGSILTNITQ